MHALQTGLCSCQLRPFYQSRTSAAARHITQKIESVLERLNFCGRVMLWQLVNFLDQARCATTCPKEHVARVPTYAVLTIVVL